MEIIWDAVTRFIIPDKWMEALMEMEEEYRVFVQTYYQDFGGES